MPYSTRPDATPTFSSKEDTRSNTQTRYTPTPAPIKTAPATPTTATPTPPTTATTVATSSSGGFTLAQLLVGILVISGGFASILILLSLVSPPTPAPEPTEHTVLNKTIDVAEKGIDKAPILLENGLDKASEALDEIK